jgi:hypothetical protein
MGEVVPFPKSAPRRNEVVLIEEARALYESVFPTEKGPAGGEPQLPAPRS